ncbi:GntR family transcriptional regulator [Streptomyces sp. NPDC058256]|uniref:GntR family transcriptional regulator n=1 Tax=Streptomyces sp. NPDC058256 TaxID=3346408 RepID=UPI0036E76786
MPRRRYPAECERIIKELYTAIHQGACPPGTPLPDIAELQSRYGTDQSSARAAVECLFQQGIVSFPLEGGGLYFVNFVPTDLSRFHRQARPVPTFRPLMHLHRPAHREWAIERPAETNSLCGMSNDPADGSGRTTDPGASTCPACLKVYAEGGNLLGPHRL